MQLANKCFHLSCSGTWWSYYPKKSHRQQESTECSPADVDLLGWHTLRLLCVGSQALSLGGMCLCPSEVMFSPFLRLVSAVRCYRVQLMLFLPGEIKLPSKFQLVKENLTPHAVRLEASRLFSVTWAKLYLYFQQISSKKIELKNTLSLSKDSSEKSFHSKTEPVLCLKQHWDFQTEEYLSVQGY